MEAIHQLSDRLTTADQVFEALYDQIVGLKLSPGTRISEAQVAKEFGVSRQPVREAFNRLGAAGLLVIRPQRGTMVQKFSRKSIASARFVRLSVELEVLSEAAQRWSGALSADFEAILAAQTIAASEMDRTAFHTLDEDFHFLLAQAADQPSAFEVIKEKKAQLDRLCVLSLKNADEMTVLIDDHRKIFAAISNKDISGAQSALRQHLSRISATIDAIHARHEGFFVD